MLVTHRRYQGGKKSAVISEVVFGWMMEAQWREVDGRRSHGCCLNLCGVFEELVYRLSNLSVDVMFKQFLRKEPQSEVLGQRFSTTVPRPHLVYREMMSGVP